MSVLKHPQRVLAEVELVSSHFGEIDIDTDTDNNRITVFHFDLPSPFNRETSKLLIIIPNNYPESPPTDMYLNTRLKKNGKTPEHYFEDRYGNSDIRDEGYAWYSIHFKSWQPSSRSIIQGDNLLVAINALYDALKFDEKER